MRASRKPYLVSGMETKKRLRSGQTRTSLEAGTPTPVLMVAIDGGLSESRPAVSQRQARERDDGADVYRSEAR